jgi:biotin-dependent carboxylase-like uncharacterized protein
MIEVVSPGPLTLVEDLGRPGFARWAVAPAGAFDRAALRLANRLVGTAESAAGLETLGGLVLRIGVDCVVAVTGASGPLHVVRAGVRAGRDRSAPLHLRAGDLVEVGTPTDGLRAYLAVRGGLDAMPVLGSRSRDTLAGLGPEPLQGGDVLRVGAAVVGAPHVDHAAVRPWSGPLRVVLGPRMDWFTLAGVNDLLTSVWTVRADSDRVGIRLDGPALRRRAPDRELPSEPMVTGALQVPPDGRPVILGPDRPSTGGYPVIAVVVDADLDRLAQLRPGDRLVLATLDTPPVG